MSPGIYKGAGGIYNGRGVYNDGAGGGGQKITIGEHDYNFVQICNLLWTVQNLDYKYSPGIVGSKARYYNNDETTYGWNGKRYGLLYNQTAVNDLNNYLVDGWRVPTLIDFNNLISAVGGSGNKLKSETEWSGGGNGTNESGFNAFPSGTFFSNAFHDIGFVATFKSKTISSGLYYALELKTSNTINKNLTGGSDMYSIRLCKDA